MEPGTKSIMKRKVKRLNTLEDGVGHLGWWDGGVRQDGGVGWGELGRDEVGTGGVGWEWG